MSCKSLFSSETSLILSVSCPFRYIPQPLLSFYPPSGLCLYFCSVLWGPSFSHLPGHEFTPTVTTFSFLHQNPLFLISEKSLCVCAVFKSQVIFFLLVCVRVHACFCFGGLFLFQVIYASSYFRTEGSACNSPRLLGHIRNLFFCLSLGLCFSHWRI